MLKRRTFLGSIAASAAVATLPGSSLAADLAPFKLFDTHAHFYTDDFDSYPVDASGARYGAERMLDKIRALPMTPENVFAFWDSIGVEQGTGVQYNSTYKTDNSYLLDVSLAHPERILPVVILDPVDAATPGMLRDMARNSRLTAVRFSGSPNANGEVAFLSEAAQPVWATANELGIAIVLMPLGGNIPAALVKIGEHAKRYANVKVVIDHVGFPRPDLLPDTLGLSPQHIALADIDNIYGKLTNFMVAEMEDSAERDGNTLGDLKPIVQNLVRVFGADHLVWGSDYGNAEVDQIEYTQRMLAATEGLPLEARKAIFYDNAKAIFVPGGRG